MLTAIPAVFRSKPSIVIVLALFLLLAAAPPADAQHRLDLTFPNVKSHWFDFRVSRIPAGAEWLQIHITTGGNTFEKHTLGVRGKTNTDPLNLIVGSFNANLSKVKPNTTYHFAIRALRLNLSAISTSLSRSSVTTPPRPAPISSDIQYRQLRVTESSITLEITSPVNLHNQRWYFTRFLTGQRCGQVRNPTRVLTPVGPVGPGSSELDSWNPAFHRDEEYRPTVKYCNLRPDTDHVITMHVYRCPARSTNGGCLPQLIKRRQVTIRTRGRQGFSQNLNAPPPPPTNTPVPPPPPTNTPLPPPPPTNTPVPPPPPTSTPIPPPPPTSTPVPAQASEADYQVPDRLVDLAEDYFEDNYDPQTQKGGHNWYRVLLAFGASAHPDLPSLLPMSAKDACDRVSSWSGWQPFCDALTNLGR